MSPDPAPSRELIFSSPGLIEGGRILALRALGEIGWVRVSRARLASSCRCGSVLRHVCHPRPARDTGRPISSGRVTHGPTESCYRSVPKNTATHPNKSNGELCRNCVRSPRNRRQTRTFTGSHRDAFCGGRSLNRLREEVFQYHSVSVARVAFQACSFICLRSRLNHASFGEMSHRRGVAAEAATLGHLSV
jgi:hypothetical protein